MTVTTNEHGQQNMWAKEPRMYITERAAQAHALETHAEKAERLNGQIAMVGFVSAILSYSLTGNLFFGLL